VLMLGLIPFMGFSAFLPSYGRHIGMDSVGPVFAFYAAIVLCIRIFGARIPDRLGVRALTTTALVANTLGATIVVAWAEPAGIWVAVAIYAVGMALLFPALFALVIGGVDEDERSRAVGTFSIFFDLAGGVGVPLLGAIVSLANERSAFAVTIGVGLLALLALQRLVATVEHSDMTAYAESVPP
jgi:MFS family permease